MNELLLWFSNLCSLFNHHQKSFKNRGGQTVFQQYDSTTGTPKAVENSYLGDAFHTYGDNPKLLPSVTNCKLPAGN